MNNKGKNLRLKELRDQFSKKLEIVDQIQTIENFDVSYRLDVLLINDDPSENFLCSKYLSDSNKINSIVSMPCPHEAVSYLSGLQERSVSFPKLILLDVQIPGMTGDEFLNTFKDLFPRKKTKIILFTIEDEPDIVNNNRVIGQLSKPIDINLFEDIIRKYF